MLTTLADILNQLRKHEVTKLQDMEIKHAPTIGAMYEGLSQKLLSSIIPSNLNLQVVSGFAEFPDGSLSRQLDCMLVTGEGKQVPHTTSYIWPIESILCVFEVKKTLFGRELYDSHLKLESVYAAYNQYVAREGVQYEGSGHRFVEMVGRQPSDSITDQALLAYFSYENYAPIRVVFGYDGFKTHEQLRRAYIKHYRKDLETKRPPISPSEFPHLVICGENSLVRFNGHPYLGEMQPSEFWPVLATSPDNPLFSLIEFIWYRLASNHGVKLPDDVDIYRKSKAVILGAKLSEPVPGELGITYTIETTTIKDAAVTDAEWAPKSLSLADWKLLRILQIAGPTRAADDKLVEWAKMQSVDIPSCVDRLISERIVVEADGHLVVFRERLFTTIHDGKIWTVFDFEKGKLNKYAKEVGAESKLGNRKSIKVARKLERSIANWYEIAKTTPEPSNTGLGKPRLL